MADPGSGYGGPDAASQAAGAAAEAAASSNSGFSGPASTGMSDNFGMHDDSFGQQEYGGPNNLGGSSQDHVQASFNAKNQISSKNPYGKQGFFSRVLGIDPNSIDYSNNMNLSTRLSIANNQFSKFANPQNTPGQLGYNPQYASAPVGQVRSGVQKAGYQTAYGPVMGQAREQSIGEMLARGAMGLFGGPVGMLMGQLGTQEYGLPGQPGFDSFNPNNPRAGGGILGSMMLGGLNTSQAAAQAAQAVDTLRARFSPTLAATTNAGIGSLTPASYETRADIRNRVTPTAPAMGSVFEVDGRSFIAGKNGPIELSGVSLPNFRSENPAEATIDKGHGKILGVQDYFQNQFAAPANQFETLTDKMNLGLRNDRLGTPSGIQNTGLFGENPKAAGFRTIGEMIQSVINEENLPNNQNMYGSGTPDLNDILNMYGMETVGQ
jgi:hypothetical protein